MIENMKLKMLCALAMAAMWLPAVAGNVIVKAKLDSATLVMGRQTVLHIEISQDKNVVGYFANENADTLTSKVEIAVKTDGDTTDTPAARPWIASPAETIGRRSMSLVDTLEMAVVTSLRFTEP